MYLGFILKRQTLGCGQERNSIAWCTKEELQFQLEHVIKRFPLPIAPECLPPRESGYAVWWESCQSASVVGASTQVQV